MRARAGRAGFWWRWLAPAAVLGVVYASLTSIIYWTPHFGVNPGAEPVRAGMIGLVVALTALLLTIYWQDLDEARKAAGAESSTGRTGRLGAARHTGLLGSVVGIFASGCARCQPIWLVWLGLGQASLFLIDISVWVSVVSIALLLYSLHAKLKENCQIGSKK